MYGTRVRVTHNNFFSLEYTFHQKLPKVEAVDSLVAVVEFRQDNLVSGDVIKRSTHSCCATIVGTWVTIETCSSIV
jgi:hypothetical protein